MAPWKCEHSLLLSTFHFHLHFRYTFLRSTSLNTYINIIIPAWRNPTRRSRRTKPSSSRGSWQNSRQLCRASPNPNQPRYTPRSRRLDFWNTDDSFQKAVPRRKFNIGAKVIHLNELNDEGAPSGELRYIREFRYSEPHGQWRYQLSGKSFLGTHGWILEESVQKYTGKD